MTSPLAPADARAPSAASALRSTLIAAAGLVAVLWLWHSWAVFSTSSWNDVRLAPAVALTHGESIYPGLHGAPSSWMYGPLPLWLLLPAAWAPDPAAALGVAGLLNLLLPLGAIIAVAMLTPLPRDSLDSPALRWCAVLLTLAIWPRATWQYLQADNAAIALGLLANLTLLRRTDVAACWLAAALATAPLLCKQTSIAVPLAQVIWLAATAGRRATMGHGLRLAATGAAWALLTLTLEDPAAVRLALFTLPGGLPWAQDLGERLASTGPALAVHLLVPGLSVLWLRRQGAATIVALPTLTWVLALAPGLAALLTYGGNLNSLQGLGLWLPAGSTVLLAVAARRLTAPRVALGAATLALVLTGWRLAIAPAYPWGLNHARYDRAEQIAELMEGKVWFPWHPLVTLYANGRRYADEDGLAVRALAGLPMSREQLAPQLPPDFSAIALPAATAHWGVAYELSPPQAQHLQIGEWLIDDWSQAVP